MRTLLFFALSLTFLSPFSSANSLTISDNFQLSLCKHQSIAHLGRDLIVDCGAYKLTHQLVDSKSLIGGVDLTGIEQEFFISAATSFDYGPDWLQLLARNFRNQYGPDKALITNLGKSKLIGFSKLKDSTQTLYLLESGFTHQITIFASSKTLEDTFKLIQARKD